MGKHYVPTDADLKYVNYVVKMCSHVASVSCISDKYLQSKWGTSNTSSCIQWHKITRKTCVFVVLLLVQLCFVSLCWHFNVYFVCSFSIQAFELCAAYVFISLSLCEEKKVGFQLSTSTNVQKYLSLEANGGKQTSSLTRNRWKNTSNTNNGPSTFSWTMCVSRVVEREREWAYAHGAKSNRIASFRMMNMNAAREQATLFAFRYHRALSKR